MVVGADASLAASIMDRDCAVAQTIADAVS